MLKGAFKHFQKFLLVYGQILDLPPFERHNLKNIFLIASVNTKYYSSIDKVFEIIFENIKAANSSKDRKFDIKVKFICGDTPMVQSVGGFIEAVGSANYPCRECIIHKSELGNYLFFKCDFFIF